MADRGGILALDISLMTGVAYGGVRDTAPDFDRWPIRGGIADMAEAWIDLQNKLEDFCELQRPSLIVYAAPFAKQQTSARLGLGLAAHAESSGKRMGIMVREAREDKARKEILGRAQFGERDIRGKIIKGTGSKAAKETALGWCRSKGWMVPDHNAADACVIWEWARRFVLSRQQWGQWNAGTSKAAF